MTQPLRGKPREQRQTPTAQVCVWIGAQTKDDARARAKARGERLRDLVERAIVAELAKPADS